MKFIPTITDKFNRFDITQYNEILLTPSMHTKTILPINYEGDIIIDNGGYVHNKFGINKKRAKDHIKLCSRISNDPRCIFVLPDFKKDVKLTEKFIKKFLKKVKPNRYILVDMHPGWVEHIEVKYNLSPEFYATYKKEIPRIPHSKYSKYHVFGKINSKKYYYLRSYDTTTP